MEMTTNKKRPYVKQYKFLSLMAEILKHWYTDLFKEADYERASEAFLVFTVDSKSFVT